jgi:tRNA(Ile)-lysidine synthase
MSLLEKVAALAARHRMWEPGQKVGVAVSGGADSVCLLHLLHELAPCWNLGLTVLHLNHGLRGDESAGDAEFVTQLAQKSGLRCEVRETDLRSAAGNLEQAARQARLAFFTDVISTGTVHRVALGHTRSDQAETVLFRFLRGAGTAGLAGIRPVTTTGLVRPLLEIDRTEVEQFLRERSIPWREDSTNRSRQFARNRIRQDLLPALARDWNPAISVNLAQIADWAQAEESYWESEIDCLAERHLTVLENGSVLLKTDSLRELPLAPARRLIRRAMESVKGDLRSIDFAHVNAILNLAGPTEGHGRIQVPELDVIRSFNWLRFAPVVANGLESRNYAFQAPVPGLVPLPGSQVAISLQLIEKSNGSEGCLSVYNKEMVAVDWERLSGSLTVRNWRPGDQYQPLGSAGEAKIKTLFQESRIPLWERRHWPVLVDGETIVWSRGFGPAVRFAAGPGTRTLLAIREIGIGSEHGGVYMNEGR